MTVSISGALRASRELHTAGGFYLLLLELTGRSRRLRGSPSPLLAKSSTEADPKAQRVDAARSDA
ncbi:hypothetical protein [Streptomyces sp. NPDC052015]|uniref:hypothetical protein n=1 Tax=Streptomyces sp. NPDC052015 TaxID=3154755 RepID=UPI0034189C31